MIGGDQVAPLGRRDHVREGAPLVGPEVAGAAAVEPVKLGLGHGEDAAQGQGLDAVGMGLGVEQREAGAPGAAEDDPALDAERLADALDVGNEVPGGVGLHGGVGRRAAAAALVEEHDAVMGGSKKRRIPGSSCRPGRRAARRPARRQGGRIAPHRPGVPGHVEHLLAKGLDGGWAPFPADSLAADVFLHGGVVYPA